MAHLLLSSAVNRNSQGSTDHEESDITTDVESHDGAQLATLTVPTPTLFHKVKDQRSILALLVSDSRIFAGTQCGDILVWSLETFDLLSNKHAHRGSVLCLCLSADKKLLFSSAGDAIVNVYVLL
jgi:di- and tripeptidase